MARKRWIGGAAAIPQVAQKNVASSTLGQTFTISLKFEDNTSVTIVNHAVSAPEVGNTTTIAAAIVAEFVASTHELASGVITPTNSTSKVILTAIAAGKPFYVGYGGTGTWDNTGCTNTSSSGPNDFNVAANFSSGTVFANGDDLFAGAEASTYPILYGLYQNAITAGDIELPYGGPLLGTYRFGLRIGWASLLVGESFALSGLLAASQCQHLVSNGTAGPVVVLATGSVGIAGYEPLLLDGTLTTVNAAAGTASYIGVGVVEPGVGPTTVTDVVNSGTGRITLGEEVTTLGTATNAGTGSLVSHITNNVDFVCAAGDLYTVGESGDADTVKCLGGVTHWNARNGGGECMGSITIAGGEFNSKDRIEQVSTALLVFKSGTIAMAYPNQIVPTTTDLGDERSTITIE